MSHLKFSNEDGFEEYTQPEIGATVDFLCYEFGPHYTDYNGEKTAEFTIAQTKDTISLVDFEVYFLYGFSFSISVDYEYVSDCVVKLFE